MIERQRKIFSVILNIFVCFRKTFRYLKNDTANLLGIIWSVPTPIKQCWNKALKIQYLPNLIDSSFLYNVTSVPIKLSYCVTIFLYLSQSMSLCYATTIQKKLFWAVDTIICWNTLIIIIEIKVLKINMYNHSDGGLITGQKHWLSY